MSYKAYSDTLDFIYDSFCRLAFEKAGVLDLWFEPVYEEEKLKIGNYEVKFNNSIGVMIDGQFYNKKDIKDLYINMRTYPQIKSLNVGCNGQYQIDKEFLKKILDKFDKM